MQFNTNLNKYYTSQTYLQYVQQPLSQLAEISKCLVQAEMEFLKEKPVKAITLLAAYISSLALPIIFHQIVIPSVVMSLIIEIALSALGCISIYFNSQEITRRAIKINASRYIEANSIEKVKNKEVILVLQAEYDHNGAFNTFPEKAFKEKYPLAIRKITHFTQIAQAIDDAVSQGNVIKGLWIKAHGSPDSITLGKCDKKLISKAKKIIKNMNYYYSLAKEDQEHLNKYYNSSINSHNVHLLETSLTKLDKNAFIGLDSCETAGTPEFGKNIAQRIAEFARGRKVFASSKVTSAGTTYIDPKALEVKFFYADKHTGFVNKVKSIGGVILFLMNWTKLPLFHHDVTQIYQYEPKRAQIIPSQPIPFLTKLLNFFTNSRLASESN